MTGLTHPHDLMAWQRWQQSRQPLARRASYMARGMLRRSTPDPVVSVATRGSGPVVVSVLDSISPSSRLSLSEPATVVDGAKVVIVSPTALDLDPSWSVESLPLSQALLHVQSGTPILSSGHFVALGRAAFERAQRVGARFITTQHGLMTPHAPPLATGTHLLAWSEQDADFWRSGRTDVTSQVVGSQLLWNAAHTPATASRDLTPVFLGQLHGAELPRDAVIASTERFLLSERATYRPHPSERDRASLRIHDRWERKGISIDRSPTSLPETQAPVVSAFSTGLLEAAAQGRPAWAHFDNPPAWLIEFWSRYGIHTWGQPPTPAPIQPATEPVVAIANTLREMIDS